MFVLESALTMVQPHFKALTLKCGHKLIFKSSWNGNKTASTIVILSCISLQIYFIFIVLKLVKIIEWSWAVVHTPLWILVSEMGN